MACIIGNYSFEFVEGDTYSGFAVRLTTKGDEIGVTAEPIDLTGATIQMRISSTDQTRKKTIDLTTYNKRIIVTDAVNGYFSIIKQKIKLPEGLYEHSLQVKFANGDTRTYLSGNVKVIPNTTSKNY
jgi:hypothetical protein